MATESAKGNRHHRTHVALQDLTLIAARRKACRRKACRRKPCRSALQSANIHHGEHGEHGESFREGKSGAAALPTIICGKSGA